MVRQQRINEFLQPNKVFAGLNNDENGGKQKAFPKSFVARHQALLRSGRIKH